eukprot:81413_1
MRGERLPLYEHLNSTSHIRRKRKVLIILWSAAIFSIVLIAFCVWVITIVPHGGLPNIVKTTPHKGVGIFSNLGDNWCDAELGSKGAVSSTNHFATEVGADILRRGGNAADAAVAMVFVLGVAQPQSTGIGGGGFALIYDAKQKRVHALDGREEAPSAAHEYMFCNTTETQQNCQTTLDCTSCDSGEAWVYDELHVGGLTVGVPGTPAMLSRLLDDFGSKKLSLSELAAPAIKLARDGVPVSDNLHLQITRFQYALDRFPAARKLFLTTDGQPLPVGALFRNTDLADTYELLASDGGMSDFYNGQLAREIVEAQKDGVNPVTGMFGTMELSDLAAYKAVYRETVNASIHNLTVVGMGPPSGGGFVIAQLLDLINASTLDLSSFSQDSSLEYLHRLIDLLNIVHADKNAFFADPDWCDIPEKDLRKKDYLRQRAMDYMTLWHGAQVPVPPGDLTFPNATKFGIPPPQEEHGTTHLVVVDGDGSMISLTSSIEENLGSKIVVPGRGFLLNNQLTDFTALPTDISGDPYLNRIEGGKQPRRSALNVEDRTPGGKRPLSSMAPTILLDENDRPVLGIGSPGGGRIAATLVNVLLNLLFFDMKLGEATDMPRLVATNHPDHSAQLETSMWVNQRLVKCLEGRGFNVIEYKTKRPLGFVESIALRYMSDGSKDMCAVADSRMNGSLAEVL